MGVERQIPEDLVVMHAGLQVTAKSTAEDDMRAMAELAVELIERIADLAAEVERLRGNLLKTTNNLSSELDELLRVKTALGDSRATVETLKGLLRENRAVIYTLRGYLCTHKEYQGGYMDAESAMNAADEALNGTDQQLQPKGEQG